MTTLQFEENLTLPDIFKRYKKEILESVIESIKKNYENREINEINVVKINSGSNKYSINLTRDKFIETLNRCIDFFVELEMYEYCQECVNIIRALQEK